MTAVKRYTLPVEKLKPGMVIHSIAVQSGKLVVKKKGRVRHLNIIDQLIASGVESVVIEHKVANPKTSAKPASPPKLPKKADVASKSEQIKESEIKEQLETIDLHDEFESEEVLAFPKLSTPTPSSFEDELDIAEGLVIECKKLHKKLALNIEKGLKIDVSESKKLVSELQLSLMRNPDALLCLSMIRNEGQYLSNHAMHTSILMCHFAQHLGFSEVDCQRLGLLGYFFDIGMLKVPKHILNKQGRPTEEEHKLIQAHVWHSLELLEPLKLDNEIKLAIEQHHERLDGSGYPHQLIAEDIHKFSRMLAIVDCYDAMTTNRPHQKKSTPASALKMISNKEFGYDTKLAMQFIRCMGVYPVGSLVVLSNNHIAVVIKTNRKDALKPKVRQFYNISGNEYVDTVDINLADGIEISIQKPTLAEIYQIDISRAGL
uniref:HD domain-containing phosphohydrolase n=1 Tax=Ningiella ruwaisensis TaxID=2364274 RepID=UPI00109F4EA6|nr:HD domain-containing phosphohydrolase [Ningiella ruwaisensis]